MLLVDLKQLETNKQASIISHRFQLEPTLYMIPDSKPFLLFTKN